MSEEIAKCTEELGFPQATYVYYAKNTSQKVIDVATNLRDLGMMSMSKQSLNEKTLELVKRKNISHEKFDELRDICEERGIKTFC